jgi:thiol-disulfide isomerase/thioredoxin
MAFVVAALVLVGLLGVVNLIFSFGVIRRLREHTGALDRLSHGGAGGGERPVMTVPGAVVEDFAASTVDGEPVARDLLAGTTLVGFLTPSCQPCQERLPLFVERAKEFERAQVLAVVVAPDSDEDAPAVVEQLVGVARVVREPNSGPLATAFGVQGFPAFGLVGPDGAVVASGFELSGLNVPAPV